MKVKFHIKGTSPILQHKFNGLKEEKELKEKGDKEQAEAHAYRLPNGNLGIPSEWIKGCLRNYLISTAPSKKKTETKNTVSARITVEPYMLDLGVKDYTIDKRSVPAGNMSRGGVRDFCVRPKIEGWEVEGMLITTLDKKFDDLKRDFAASGVEVGIGSNRPNGYGRFAVTQFSQV
jgi:hypothetical protein